MKEDNKKQHEVVTNPESDSTEKKKSFLATRMEYRKLKKQQREQENSENEEPKKVRWVQIRLIPIWLRIIIVLGLLVVVAIGGLYFGYSVIGDGDPGDVLKKTTWTHITDIISGKE